MAAHFFFLGVLAHFTSSAEAKCIPFTTPKQLVAEKDFQFTLLSDHGFLIGSRQYISFEVKACRDAHIGLMETNDHNNTLYTIRIGESSTNKTILYKNKLSTPVLTSTDDVHLNCGNFEKFQLEWKNGDIMLWNTGGMNAIEILSYITDTAKIKYIGVTTSVWADGEWRIFDQDPTGANTDDSASCEKTAATNGLETTTAAETTTTTDAETTTVAEKATTTVAETTSTTAAETTTTTGVETTTAAETTTSGMETKIDTATAAKTKTTSSVETTMTAETTTTATGEDTKTIAKEMSTTTTDKIALSSKITSTPQMTLNSSSDMCQVLSMTNVSATTTCIRVCHIDITHEQLMVEIKKLKEELKVNKESLSRQKNSLLSADDRRISAAAIGYMGVVIIASLCFGIVLIDLQNLIRMIQLMKRNIIC